MKVILSRKGFDSSYGGYPSPILPGGQMISMPIPDKQTNIRYRDLCFGGKSYFQLINDIGLRYLRDGVKKNAMNVAYECHLDPDIYSSVFPRKEGWKGLFGQLGAAQSHLDKNQVGVGDLFLFFGWFADTIRRNGKLCYNPLDKDGRHIIYGYLQVGAVIKVDENAKLPGWMKYHPHNAASRRAKKGNSIYVATDTLSWDNTKPGFGTFSYSDDLVLTKDGYSRSKWRLPDFFRELTITYHSEKNWKEDYFQSACRGQEFVIEENEQVEQWAKRVVKEHVEW